MAELDSKEKVLIAIYAEYQKDIPDMRRNINYKQLNMDKNVFYSAIDKLHNEELVNGLKIVTGGNRSIPVCVFTDNAKMSVRGIEYVENKMGIKPELSGMEKVQAVSSKAAEWGFDQAKDFFARVLAECIKDMH